MKGNPALKAWGDGALIGPLTGGARSRVLLCRLDGTEYAARWQRESEASLRWVERAKRLAARTGFRVASLLPTQSGALSAGGWTLEPFLPGRRATEGEVAALGPRLAAFHALARRMPKRPGHPPMAVRGGRWARLFPTQGFTAIHGDLHPRNVLIGAGGPALIDWEESRRDAAVFDHMIPGSPLHCAYEAAICWHTEPERARDMAARVRRLTGGAVW